MREQPRLSMWSQSDHMTSSKQSNFPSFGWRERGENGEGSRGCGVAGFEVGRRGPQTKEGGWLQKDARGRETGFHLKPAETGNLLPRHLAFRRGVFVLPSFLLLLLPLLFLQAETIQKYKISAAHVQDPLHRSSTGSHSADVFQCLSCAEPRSQLPWSVLLVPGWEVMADDSLGLQVQKKCPTCLGILVFPT